MPKTITQDEFRALRAVLVDARENARTVTRQVRDLAARLEVEPRNELLEAAVWSDCVPLESLLERLGVEVEPAGGCAPAAGDNDGETLDEVLL